jgi:hypothetical protein
MEEICLCNRTQTAPNHAEWLAGGALQEVHLSSQVQINFVFERLRQLRVIAVPSKSRNAPLAEKSRRTNVVGS